MHGKPRSKRAISPASPDRRNYAVHVAAVAPQPRGAVLALTFDLSAARHYADLAVEARISGKGFPTPDGYIAAIAASRGFAVASRDIGAFRAAGMTVIDPWKVAPRS